VVVSVVVGHPLTDDQLAPIRAIPGVSVRVHELADQEAADAFVDAEVEVLYADVVPADLSRVPRLRWVQYSGAGVDELVLPPNWAERLVVTTASGANAVPIAEYVMAAILSVSQRHAERAANQRDHHWAWDASRAALFGRGLTGTTLTLVGYGSIGREVARLARAFGMRVLAVKRDVGTRRDDGWTQPGRGDPDGSLPERIVAADGLAEVVAQARYVVVAAPATAATRGVLGDAVLRAMTRDAWLINVGRGTLFDRDAITRALVEGRIAGAFLDVTAPEPLPADDPLWDLPTVRITPHVAGAHDASWDVIGGLFADNLRRFTAGEPLLNRVGGDGY
jgi:phosphoglycerate dehydrogenase-like enzyme